MRPVDSGRPQDSTTRSLRQAFGEAPRAGLRPTPHERHSTLIEDDHLQESDRTPVYFGLNTSTTIADDEEGRHGRDLLRASVSGR